MKYGIYVTYGNICWRLEVIWSLITDDTTPLFILWLFAGIYDLHHML